MDQTAVYELCKAVHAIYVEREKALAYRDGDRSLLDQFTLTAEQRQALAGKDLVALFRLGVHPVLLYHLSVVLNSREAYVREIAPQLKGIPNPFYDYYQSA